MSDLPILGESKAAEDAPKLVLPEAEYDLPSDEDLLNENTEDTTPNVLCVFSVVVDLDGNAQATNDTVLEGVIPAREASLQDIRRGALEVVEDVRAIQVSQQTVALMQQQAQAMAQQSQEQKMKAALAQRNLRAPGQ